MFFRKKWIEVYNTSELEKLYRAKNLLSESNIDYKTGMVNNNLRLSMNHMGRGTGIALGRSGVIKDYHSILVEEKDQNKARGILSEILGKYYD